MEQFRKTLALAFNMAWEAYKSGTVPIGAVIVNTKGMWFLQGEIEY